MKKQRQTDDPILTPREMADDGGISLATWRRHYRDKLPIVRLSPRRVGARLSAWRQALEENTTGGRAA